MENSSVGRNDLTDLHLSNQDLTDVHLAAVEANQSVGRKDFIDVHLSNQEFKDVHPAVEANQSVGRNDLTDVHLSNEDVNDVHPAVEENPSLGRNDLTVLHLSNVDVKDVHPAVEANPSLGRNDLIDVHLSIQDLKDVHSAVEANQSVGRNDLTDVLLSNEDVNDVHPAVEANPSLGRNDLTVLHLSNEGFKDVHLAVEANPSLGINDLIDVHLSNQDLKDVHTAVETNNGGCIFFAQGHCPFGIDCWFSHLGSERSCIGEASTSSRSLWLPGISPPPGNDHEPHGNNQDRATFVRDRVCELENQSLLLSVVKELYGYDVYKRCCKDGKPQAISCWFQPEVKGHPIFNNQFLSWPSPKRSNSPWEGGVTRVDRRWVQLTAEERNIVGPIRSKLEEDRVGPVRDQKDHSICWAYVAVDLVSAMRLINGQEDTFVRLSVRELCFYARPQDRLMRTEPKRNHMCHELRVEFAFDYIMSTGVRRQGEDEEIFDCIEGGPGEGGDTVRIEDYTFLGENFKAALQRLQMLPIGASVHVFQEFWSIKKGDIYRGPTSNNTKYCGVHALIIVDAFLINGELIFWCKSSSGIHFHDEGYIMVAAAIMVLGLHYESESDEPTFGIRRDRQRRNIALHEPVHLIGNFVYPRMQVNPRKGKGKRKRSP